MSRTALTATQRAAVRVALAVALADGRNVTGAQIADELYGQPAPAPAPAAVPAGPDTAITVEAAAARLGVVEATVRRYLAPSSGRLTRLGDGVSWRSVRAYADARVATLARTRWTAAAPADRRAA